MVLSTLLFSLMHVGIRIASHELHAFEIAFFRNLIGMVFLVPLFVRSGLGVVRTDRIGLHVVHALATIGAMLLFYSALSLAPLAKVMALGFLAPIFVSIIGLLLLRERMKFRRWVANLFGIAGMLIILRPGFIELDNGAMMVIVSTLLWSFSLIVARVLSPTEGSLTIVLWLGLFLSAFSFGPALLVWQNPSPWAWVWLAFVGVTGAFA